jgi:acetyl esterase/lipase
MLVGWKGVSSVVIATSVLLSFASAASAQDAMVEVETNVIYGADQGSALVADLAYPSGARGMPAIVYVHGGSWRGGSRNGNGALDVEQWAGFGFFAMTIDYRLVLASPAPAPYQDVLTAIRWVHAHAAEYGIDPDRVYLIGNSAGGHLASLVATLGDGPFPRTGGWDEARSDVRGVISVSGAYDVNALSWGNLWTPLAGDVEEARRLASPIRHVGPDAKPILLIHSNDDTAVPVEQALNMVQTLAAAGAAHRFIRWEDKGHMGILPEVVPEARAFIAEIERGLFGGDR